MSFPSHKIIALSENALTLQLAPEISEDQVRFLYHIRKCMLESGIKFIDQILVTFNELTVFYDSSLVTADILRKKINEVIKNNHEAGTLVNSDNIQLFKIPVCYDPDMALDRSRLENHTGLSFEKIVDRHHQADYTFYMMGFLPGFLYLGGLDNGLACPRLKDPRQKVLSGSVGIAGEQTGIYPIDSPGGWNIIGRTPLNLFDFRFPAIPDITLNHAEQRYTSETNEKHELVIQPLDTIKFVPISLSVFQHLHGMTLHEYQKFNTNT